jgi:hypothetical protein
LVWKLDGGGGGIPGGEEMGRCAAGAATPLKLRREPTRTTASRGEEATAVEGGAECGGSGMRREGRESWNVRSGGEHEEHGEEAGGGQLERAEGMRGGEEVWIEVRRKTGS